MTTSSWGRPQRKIQGPCDGLAPKKSAPAKPSATGVIPGVARVLLLLHFLMKLLSGGLGSRTRRRRALFARLHLRFCVLFGELTHRLCYRAILATVELDWIRPYLCRFYCSYRISWKSTHELKISPKEVFRASLRLR